MFGSKKRFQEEIDKAFKISEVKEDADAKDTD